MNWNTNVSNHIGAILGTSCSTNWSERVKILLIVVLLQFLVSFYNAGVQIWFETIDFSILASSRESCNVYFSGRLAAPGIEISFAPDFPKTLSGTQYHPNRNS